MSSVMDPKDPDEVIDYTFDWTKWLANSDNDTIASQNVTATEVTVDSTAILGGTKVVVMLSGGAAGDRALVTCTITTVANRVATRTMTIPVKSL